MNLKPKFMRVFLLIVTLVLMLAPLNILAASSKTKINYVSLGDSLAHGLLSDGQTLGTGFVGNIKKSLENKGYEVKLTNKGFSGYKTTDVINGLSKIQELSEADIVTLSAGANDLLGHINYSILDQINPEYFDENKVFEKFNYYEQEILKYSDVASNFSDLKSELQSLPGLLPPELTNLINSASNNIGLLLNAVDTLIASMKGSDETDPNLIFNQINEYIEMTIDDLESIISFGPNLKQSYPIFEEIIDEKIGKVSNLKTKLEDAKTLFNDVNKFYNELMATLAASTMLANAKNEISNVGQNIAAIIQSVKQVNPNAKIYVMGYYNALPYLEENVQNHIKPIIKSLNTAIQTAAIANNAKYIETYDIFDGKHQTYLPNPANIHPNEEGYRAIAQAFMAEIEKDFPPISTNEPEQKEIKVKLGDKVAVQKGQTVKIEGTNVTLILPNDLPNGTVLTITKTDNKKIQKAKGLKAVGDVLDFHFEFPSQFQNYKGTFQLIMGYSGGSSNVDIYYYDEQSETWIKQNGKHNPQSNTIQANVTHFSNYGVFAQINTNDADDSESNDESDESTDDFEAINDNESNDNSSNETGKKLPKTASNNFNLIVIGFVMIIIGAIFGIKYAKKPAVK